MKMQATVEERLALIESNRIAGHDQIAECECGRQCGHGYDTPSPINAELLEDAVDGAYQAVASLTRITQYGTNKEKIAASKGLNDLLVSLSTFRD